MKAGATIGNRRVWMYWPHLPRGSKLPPDVKQEVTRRAQKIVDEWKPEHIKKRPKNSRANYIIKLYTKWHRNFFYFCATFACPSPKAISPTFENRFTRIEYTGRDKFNLAYMRHTGSWFTTKYGLTMDNCFKAIRKNFFYHPL